MRPGAFNPIVHAASAADLDDINKAFAADGFVWLILFPRHLVDFYPAFSKDGEGATQLVCRHGRLAKCASFGPLVPLDVLRPA